MQITSNNLQAYLLSPIVTQWYARFAAAREAKSRFDVMSKLCRQFLGSSAKAMWDDAFRKEFYPGVASPDFMVSLNKAFELVAIIGPSLYWQNPTREVKSPDIPDQTQIAQMFGIQEQPMLEQIQQQHQMTVQQKKIRNSLGSLVLENIVREHHGGQLIDNQMVIQDALVTGRGCGWTETYWNPSTGEPRIGTFFDPVDNLLIDPDAKDPALRDVKWIHKRHIDPVWLVEQRFGYPPGYLKGRGTHLSAEYGTKMKISTEHGFYLDMMEWVEVWSIGGIGARVTGVHSGMGQALDELTGDNCYLCMTQGLPHPLNLPPVLVSNGQPEDIRNALRWRTSAPASGGLGSVFELWRDGKWPVELLDFYPVVGSVWPMAVLGPGIGSLLAMNILLVSQLTMSWDRRRDIVAVYTGYSKDIEQAIRSENNPAIIKITGTSNMKVDDVVSFIKRPEIQGNLLEWIQYLDNQFKMATGLDDIHYGVSKTQVRVQGDIQARMNASNVRPEKMAKDVHQYVINTSQKELWLAAGYVQGAQLQPLLGTWGAMAWDMLVGALPFDQLAREMEIYVEATDMRRRDRDKDMSDLEKLIPFLFPGLIQYAQDTGDTKPINAMLYRFFDASNMRNVQDLFLGDWKPAVDPQMQQMQMQIQQIESALTAAQTEETKAKTVARLIDSMYKQKGAAAPAAQKMQWDALFNQQKVAQQENEHLQKLLHTQELMELETNKEKARARD